MVQRRVNMERGARVDDETHARVGNARGEGVAKEGSSSLVAVVAVQSEILYVSSDGLASVDVETASWREERARRAEQRGDKEEVGRRVV